jgi:pyridinium-3,5-bisthiocarboxylic acid mononucleotide nickel chelatase
MNLLRFDSVGGASGDMILGALVDLGLDVREIEKELSCLDIEPFTIKAESSTDKHIAGTKVTVEIQKQHHTRHGHHHHARGLKDIEKLINQSKLSENVKTMTLKVFNRLANAEAKAHGCDREEIHFHEVGANDAIIDITGTCVCFNKLNVEKLLITSLPVGSGEITAAHGILPLPAPATLNLLNNIPITQTEEKHEMVTPTGAAILSTFKTERMSDIPPSTVIKTGYGLGHTQLDTRANLLRAALLEPVQTDNTASKCTMLQFNVDDMSPELIGALSEKLREMEAIDLFITPVQMKKNRPGFEVTVLCRTEQKEQFTDLIFTEASTFGIREYEVKRSVLNRKTITVNTEYGPIGIKQGLWKGKVTIQAPEYEECVESAKRNAVAVRKVYEAAIAAAVNKA